MSPRIKPTRKPRWRGRPNTPGAPSMSRAHRTANPARMCSPMPTRPAPPSNTRCTAHRTKSAPCSRPCERPASPMCCSPSPAARSSCGCSRARSCRRFHPRRKPARRNDLTDILKPRDAKEVEDAVRWALGEDKALEVVGQGSKRAIGRPSQTDLTLDLSGLSGVTLYEPAELVLSARAGTPLAEIEALLDKSNQELAFEPMDYGPLLGGEAHQGTIGGAIAANLSGPRRIKAGAARDHFLGVSAVTGRGDTIKSGGRVVKNVTGYDMCKVLAGSWGTLAAMTDVTIKVLPRAETEATVVVEGLDDARACAAMAAAMGSPCDVSAAAHLPDHVASYFDGLPNAEAATALRLEGVAPSVKHRKEVLAKLMKDFGPVVLLEEKESRAL